jgi:Kef-type K+ transport system membrane component KefB
MTVADPAVLLLAAEAGNGSDLGFDLFNLLLVLGAAWIAGRLAVRVGYPAVLGELMAGILLGPPLLGLLEPGAGLDVLGHLGIVLMMLYIGTEIDPDDLRRASVPGLLAAAGGFIVPAVLGFAVVLLFGGTVLAGLFVGIAVGVTSLATKSRILLDLNLLSTRIAYVLMAAALLSDTATLVAFAAIIGFVEAGGFDLAGTARVAGEAIGFFAVAAGIGLWVLPRLGRVLQERGIDDRMTNFAIVVTIGLGYAELAELAGLHAILGSFVAGMFLRRGMMGERLQREVNKLVEDVSVGFLAPIFFVAAGFQITFDVFRTDLALLISVVVVATVGKILGTALFYLPTGHGWREGITIGAAMNGRGAVEIIVAGIGLERGLISAEIFTILVFMAIATTAMVPVLLKLGVEWLERHDELAKVDEQRTAVVLIGAGPLARAVARELQGERPVWLVDANAEHVAEARREGLSAIRGDAMDPAVLRRAHITEARGLLALTPNAEVNVLVAGLAREDFLVPDVRVAGKAAPTRTFDDLLHRVGARPLLDGTVDIGMWDQWVSTERARASGQPQGRRR